MQRSQKKRAKMIATKTNSQVRQSGNREEQRTQNDLIMMQGNLFAMIYQ